MFWGWKLDQFYSELVLIKQTVKLKSIGQYCI